MVSHSLVKEFQRLLGKDQVFLQETEKMWWRFTPARLSKAKSKL